MSVFLPYEHFTINTILNSSDIKLKLSKIVEPSKMFRNPFSSDYQPYQGEIGEDNFKISRIINYRNSFLPIIIGKIHGSSIEITMRMHWLVEIFMALWIGFTGFMGLYHIFLKQEFIYKSLFPIGMSILGYLLCTIAFKAEASGSKKFLNNLFKSS